MRFIRTLIQTFRAKRADERRELAAMSKNDLHMHGYFLPRGNKYTREWLRRGGFGGGT